ncbi:hypothetical protein ACFDR9_002667 [Janthinobacterium sp. CG_23.3]|uniref:hypothetical protein n=1 Tax=unclassified Janthinobacterium TaxID=2610881 RepID=UPI0003478E55|nr:MULTISPECIES: hypothetical protein [unclassified Janthinobacterium]MEC5160425.1 hypothetical protein [Janthinobacterium sp. CG_S6]
MNQTSGRPGPERGEHLWDEPDIGSGEKTPGQKDTEEIIKQIPPLPETRPRGKDDAAPPGRKRRAGNATTP